MKLKEKCIISNKSTLIYAKCFIHNDFISFSMFLIKNGFARTDMCKIKIGLNNMKSKMAKSAVSGKWTFANKSPYPILKFDLPCV